MTTIAKNPMLNHYKQQIGKSNNKSKNTIPRCKRKDCRGERVRAITTPELITEYLKGEEMKITNIPRQGITQGRFRTKSIILLSGKSILIILNLPLPLIGSNHMQQESLVTGCRRNQKTLEMMGNQDLLI